MTAAVYMIVCTNGDYYVGSTGKKLNARWSSHRYFLNRGSHHCRRLQSCWNKYGERAFSVVELMAFPTKTDALLFEQYCIDAGRGHQLLNGSIVATHPVLTEDGIAAMRECSRAYWSNPANRAAQAQRQRAAWARDPERKRKLKARVWTTGQREARGALARLVWTPERREKLRESNRARAR